MNDIPKQDNETSNNTDSKIVEVDPVYSLEKAFEDFIPLDQLNDLPRIIKFSCGTISYILLLGCFIYFFIITFLQRQRSSFISFDDSEGICSEVERPVTGTFYATDSGSWEGDQDFQYSHAVYQFEFNDLRISSNGFKNMMVNEFDISDFKKSLTVTPLTDNFIKWMHYKIETVVNGKTQLLSMITQPSDVFNIDSIWGVVVSNNLENCVCSEISYDIASSRMNLVFPSSENCSFLETTNFVQVFQGQATYPIRVDMNQFTTIIAINSGVLSLSELEYLYHLADMWMLDVEYSVSAYYDPRYPQSGIVYCATAIDSSNPNLEINEYCLNSHNDLAMLPLLVHMAEDCNECSPENAWYCNDFWFYAVYIYSSIPISFGGLDPLAALLARVDNVALKKSLNRLLIDGDPFFFDEYCQTCYVIAIEFYGEMSTFTKYGGTLVNGHCGDAFIFGQSKYDSLGQSPPTSLVERYYECNDTPYMSFLEAAGIAFGNMEVFGTVGLICVLLLSLLMTKAYFKVKIKDHNNKAIAPEDTGDLQKSYFDEDSAIDDVPVTEFDSKTQN